MRAHRETLFSPYGLFSLRWSTIATSSRGGSLLEASVESCLMVRLAMYQRIYIVSRLRRVAIVVVSVSRRDDTSARLLPR